MPAKALMEGGCLCKSVRYVISQAPVGSVSCQCTDCQYVGGGFGVASVVALKAAFDITKGGELLKEHELPETGVVRTFATCCGTHVTACNRVHPKWRSVHAGTLDDKRGFRPAVGIWCKNKASFFSLDVPCFDEYPPQ
jgi:hypothetical protein